ncbi:Nucleoside diphosphate kinase A, partial [Crenichthys baileyi]
IRNRAHKLTPPTAPPSVNPSYRAAVRLLGLGVASQFAGNSTSQVLLKYQNSASSADMEQTFIAVKPDGVQRGLCGEIIKRFEHRGFKLVAAKFVQASEDHMKKHYLDLKDMPFYAGLCKYMSSGPIFAMVWEGQNIVKLARMMLGETNPADSKPGSIRGDLCINIGRNIIHGSDTLDNAKMEVGLWFKPEEFVKWTPCAQTFLYE